MANVSVRVVIERWTHADNDVSTKVMEVLTAGGLHGGSTFNATVYMDRDDAQQLHVALEAGYQLQTSMIPRSEKR